MLGNVLSMLLTEHLPFSTNVKCIPINFALCLVMRQPLPKMIHLSSEISELIDILGAISELRVKRICPGLRETCP